MTSEGTNSPPLSTAKFGCVVPLPAYGETPLYEQEATANRECVAAASASGKASPHAQESTTQTEGVEGRWSVLDSRGDGSHNGYRANRRRADPAISLKLLATAVALGCIISIALSPTEVSGYADVASLRVMEKAIVRFALAAECINVGDFAIDVDCLSPIAMWPARSAAAHLPTPRGPAVPHGT
jgi:hypothetical protein